MNELLAILVASIAGLFAGLSFLGIGGRMLMRVLAFITPEPPRFTWSGTFQILGLAGLWGMAAGPLLLLTDARLKRKRWLGLILGLLVFILAMVPFAIFSGFRGPIPGPTAFLWLSALTFPALFVLYGIAVNRLVAVWSSPKEPAKML